MEVNLIQISPTILVPFSSKDFAVLVEHGLTAAKIPEASLGLLKTTLLRNVAVAVSPLPEILTELLTRFESKLAALPHSRTRLERKENIVFLRFEYPNALDLSASSQELEADQAVLKDFEEQLELTCAHMRKYLGMYCRMLNREVKDKPEEGFRLYRFSLRDADYMDNAMYYSLQVEKPTVASLRLGPAFRIKFEHDALQEKQVLRVTNEDLCVGEWQGAMTRAFQVGSIDQKSLVEVINFLLSHCYRNY